MKLKKYLTVLIVLSVSALVLFANGTKESSVSDKQRIVSLAPGFTELVYALDAGDELVARTDYCDYPAQCLEVPSIGDSWMPNIELILSYQPTVVLVSSLTDPGYVESMINAGLNVQRIVFEESISGTYDMIREVGNAINRTKQGQKLATESEKRINKVLETINGQEKKTCLYVLGWGEFGDWVGTGDTFINGIIESAGGINAAKEGTSWSFSREAILQADPNVILLPDYSYAPADVNGFKTTAPYNQLTGKIITVNGSAFERQGLRTADCVETLAAILYPELF